LQQCFINYYRCVQKATKEDLNTLLPDKWSREDELRLTTVVQAKVIQNMAVVTLPLNLVAITDGARAIRNRLLLQRAVIVIWIEYHLYPGDDCCK